MRNREQLNVFVLFVLRAGLWSATLFSPNRFNHGKLLFLNRHVLGHIEERNYELFVCLFVCLFFTPFIRVLRVLLTGPSHLEDGSDNSKNK